MKLARLLAMHIVKWPVSIGTGLGPVEGLTQGANGDIYITRNTELGSMQALYGTLKDVASDVPGPVVSMAQWQLEKMRLSAESWNGHADTEPPLHAICDVVEGNCNWGEYDKRLIGKKVEIIGKSSTTYGITVYAVELEDGTTYNLIRQCLVRGKTDAERKREWDMEARAEQLYLDCRAGSHTSGWEVIGEGLRDYYRKAIKAGWVKP